MKNRKRWIISVLIVVVAISVCAMFWQTLLLYIAPKMVLAGALKDRIAQLESRISSSPVPVLARGLDAQGRNQIDLQLQTQNDLLGTLIYDMNLQTQQHPKRILADGRVSFQNKEIDLVLYLDSDFAAVSSDGILSSNFYGLNYDTFSQDIRSNKWLSLLIGESVLRSWESKIDILHQAMQQEREALPDVSQIDLNGFTMGILALDADVDRKQVMVNGAEETYHVISFETSGEEIGAGLAYLNMTNPIALSADEEVDIAFWLKDHQIRKISLKADNKGLDLYWGIAPAENVSADDLYVYFHNGTDIRTLFIQSAQTDGVLRESITYTDGATTEIHYDWQATTGRLSAEVTAKGESTQLELVLKPVENGFFVQTENMGAMMRLLTGADIFQNSTSTMTVRKGSEFETPAYKNFADCSLEDLLTLLTGLGSLIGIKMA